MNTFVLMVYVYQLRLFFIGEVTDHAPPLAHEKRVIMKINVRYNC